MKSHAARISVLTLLSAVFGVSARADAPSTRESRATISGSGNDVTIVYRGDAKASGATAAPGHAPAEDVLAEAGRLAARGAGDETVIAYLRGQQANVPPIVGTEDVRRLRSAGAGESVIAYLSRVTALDIGETAEGGPIAPSSAMAVGSNARRPGRGRRNLQQRPSMQGIHQSRAGTPRLPRQ